MTAAILRDVPSWEALADLYGKVAHDEEASGLVIGEAKRRERAERDRKTRKLEAMRFEDALQAQLEDATRVCNGHLLGRNGMALNGGKGLPDERMLWRGPEHIARKWASWELNAYWDSNPRVCLTQFQQQQAAGRRIQRDEAEAAALDGNHDETEVRETTMTEQTTDRATAFAARREQLAQECADRADQYRGQIAVRAPSAVAAGRRMPDAVSLLRRTLEGMGLLFTDYVAFPSRSSVIAVVTWNAQAAARNADGDSIWRSYIRLLLTSRENGSGKSTVADLSRWLLQCRAGRMSKVTPYGLTKVFGTFRETAIVDDAQNTFRSDKAGAELLTLMINGYTPGATWVSGKSDGKVEPASGPLMIVGKDSLIRERAEYLVDLIARSAVVRMERPDHYMPEVDEAAEARAKSLGVTLKAVTGALQGPLRQAARELAEENRGRLITDGDGGRTAQIWRPMLAVARVAGDQWYQATLQAMEDLSSAGGDLLKAEDALTELEDLRDDGRSFWDTVRSTGTDQERADFDQARMHSTPGAPDNYDYEEE